MADGGRLHTHCLRQRVSAPVVTVDLFKLQARHYRSLHLCLCEAGPFGLLPTTVDNVLVMGHQLFIVRLLPIDHHRQRRQRHRRDYNPAQVPDGAPSLFSYINAEVSCFLNNASQLPQVWGRRSCEAFFVSDVQPSQ